MCTISVRSFLAALHGRVTFIALSDLKRFSRCRSDGNAYLPARLMQAARTFSFGGKVLSAPAGSSAKLAAEIEVPAASVFRRRRRRCHNSSQFFAKFVSTIPAAGIVGSYLPSFLSRRVISATSLEITRPTRINAFC